jgi:translation initiation factor IF-3
LTRINERIRVPEVRLIGSDGEQIGLLKIEEALRYAQERDLDLVEVAPEAKPPVCRVLDYSKYKYEQALKLKQARKHQQQITVREIKFRPKIAQHDYDTKKGHVERFLRHKDKVKVTIMFRGREVTHPERGVAILDRLAEELAEFAIVEQRPLQDGRNMTMMLGPSKSVLAGQYDKGGPPVLNGEVPVDASPNGAAPVVPLAPEPVATAAEPPAAPPVAVAVEAPPPTPIEAELPDTAPAPAASPLPAAATAAPKTKAPAKPKAAAAAKKPAAKKPAAEAKPAAAKPAAPRAKKSA